MVPNLFSSVPGTSSAHAQVFRTVVLIIITEKMQ